MGPWAWRGCTAAVVLPTFCVTGISAAPLALQVFGLLKLLVKLLLRFTANKSITGHGSAS